MARRPVEKFLTAREVSELLGLHEKTVRVMACRGEIEAIRLGGPRSHLRFPESAVSRWEMSRRKASA